MTAGRLDVRGPPRELADGRLLQRVCGGPPRQLAGGGALLPGLAVTT